MEEIKNKQKRNKKKDFRKNIDKRPYLSYMKIAKKCVRFNDLDIDEKKKLDKFLKSYKEKYDNYYSHNFQKILELSFGRIISIEDYQNKRGQIVNQNKNPYIVYRIINREKDFIRVGYSGESPTWRFSKYLFRSFGNSKKKLTNFHLDLKKLKNSKEKLCKIFVFQPLYVFDNESYAKVIEQLFTIFHNKAHNITGYDLSQNNFYNPIIGDAIELAKKGKLKKELNPTWKDIKPFDLSTAIKEEPTFESIEKKLKIHHNTIIRKIDACGFTLNNGKIGIKNARAFFIKPIIESAVKKDLSIQECIRLCFQKGVIFFRNFTLKQDQINIFCEYIWHDNFEAYNAYSRHRFVNGTYSRVRKMVITEEALELMKNPLINTLKKAKRELNLNGVVIRNEKELSDILTWAIELGYTQCQDKILRLELKNFLLQINPILSLSDIAKKLDLNPTPQKLSMLRHKIYYLFKCHSIDKIRKEFWKETSIFDIFNSKNDNKRDDLISYTCRFTSMLSGLYNYSRSHSTFMGSDLARYLRKPRRTITTHISAYLALGIIKLVEQRGNYKYYSLTQKGEIFLKHTFKKK